MCLRIAAALSIAVVMTAACSAFAAPESGFIITVEDPSGRLGPAPWKIAIFNPYLGPEEQFAMKFSGTVAPGRPFTILSRRKEDHWRMSDPLSESDSQFGLVLPTLRSDGYWLARVRREGESFGGNGLATFCPWGQIVPAANSETLSITLRDRAGEYGVQYQNHRADSPGIGGQNAMRTVIHHAAAVVVLALLTGCGTAVVQHEVSITFNDPTKRLGPPPWPISVDDDLDTYDGREVDPGSAATPNTPYRGKYSVTRGAAIGVSGRSNAEELGLIIPALGGGWWKTVILVLEDGSCRGYARHSPLGDLFPESTAETLMIRGTAQPIPRANGWRFDVTIDIPPAPPTLPKPDS